MKPLVWEAIDGSYSRARTPTGWLVKGALGALTHVDDVAGTWLADGAVIPPVVIPPPVTTAKPIGINLAPIEDYSPQVAFLDMWKQSRAFISHGANFQWDTGQPIALAPDGWPASLASGQQLGSLMAWNTGPNAWPSGRYVVTYAGAGAIELRPQSGNTSTVVSSAPGRLEFDYVNTQGGLDLVITALPVRDLHVEKAGLGTFDPRFLDFVRQFGCVRFMDWQKTNNSTITAWNERATVGGKQTLKAGAAVENMIALCNEADVDAWFCMPHLASDDFVRRFATLVFQTLEPARKVYVEFSNEAWNSMFTQNAYCLAQGAALGLAGNQYEKGWRFYSKRAREILAIWKSVFGSDQRLVRVIAGQAPAWGPGSIILEGVDASNADAYAIAPYFGGGVQSATSTAAILTALRAEADGATMRTMLETNKAMAAAHGLRLLAYEGGQHLRDNADNDGSKPNSALTTMMIAANGDAGMQAIYAAHLALWKSLGLGIFTAYDSIDTWTKYGSWGALRHMSDTTSPKALALKAALVG